MSLVWHHHPFSALTLLAG